MEPQNSHYFNRVACASLSKPRKKIRCRCVSNRRKMENRSEIGFPCRFPLGFPLFKPTASGTFVVPSVESSLLRHVEVIGCVDKVPFVNQFFAAYHYQQVCY